MMTAFPRTLLVAAAMSMGTSAKAPAWAQQSVNIPLSGTLEPRCTARIHDLQVTPGEDLKVVLFIDHSCNSGHTLQLRVRKGAGADLTRTRTNYSGKNPNRTTEADMDFRYSAEADQNGMMTIVLPNPTKAEKDALLQTMSVAVLPD
jgi:hypothetical protein